MKKRIKWAFTSAVIIFLIIFIIILYFFPVKYKINVSVTNSLGEVMFNITNPSAKSVYIWNWDYSELPIYRFENDSWISVVTEEEIGCIHPCEFGCEFGCRDYSILPLACKEFKSKENLILKWDKKIPSDYRNISCGGEVKKCYDMVNAPLGKYKMMKCFNTKCDMKKENSMPEFSGEEICVEKYFEI